MSAFVACALFVFQSPAVLAREGPAPDPVLQIGPGVVTFQQVTFDLDAGRVHGTDWGQFQVNLERLAIRTRGRSGYLNVFLYDAAGARRGEILPHWVVENMFVLDPEEWKCPEAERSRITAASHAHYFDLRPGVVGDGTVENLLATVLFSGEPLPVVEQVLPWAAELRSMRFDVVQSVEDAEGDLSAFDPARPPPIRGRIPSLLLGFPPQETIPLPGIAPELFFPIGTFQEACPNVQAANNQCVPVAHANALAYLEHRYNASPLIWNLPHLHVRGIGKTVVQGDILLTEPVPPHSIVANVDFFTARGGVFDFETGGGSNTCQNFLGLLGYLNAFGSLAKVQKVRHQGTDAALIGDDTVCDPGNVVLGGLTSTREGENPTWEWMRDQLQAGRGVTMGFGRYDADGNWTSGHMVRVYGAAQYIGKKYLYTLDDGDQGDDFVGLRTQDWELTDNDTPGNPGVPNGRLEMDGMSWEIVIAISVEPKPTSAFP